MFSGNDLSRLAGATDGLMVVSFIAAVSLAGVAVGLGIAWLMGLL